MMVMRIVHLMWYSGGSTLEDCLEGGGCCTMMRQCMQVNGVNRIIDQVVHIDHET